MPWPMAADYSATLQNPRVAFKDPELQQSTIPRNANNQPLGIAGQFAVIYRATLPDGRSLAIRAFTSDKGKDRNERYRVISEYLAQRQPLRSLVPFRYHDKGIRSLKDGKMYPLMTMEWVSGVLLYDWLSDRCRNRDQRQLSDCADRWVELISELNAAQIAHGDLQHGNVIVTSEGQLKLVDYDVMCVPKLVGLPNLEIGVEPYQHPERDGNTKLSLDLDNFSALFIYVALRALTAAPGLWSEYVQRIQYEKLLIRREDFENPAASELYRALQKSPDQDVRRLSKTLFELWRGKMEEVPRLSQLLVGHKRLVPDSGPPRMPQAPPRKDASRSRSVAAATPQPSLQPSSVRSASPKPRTAPTGTAQPRQPESESAFDVFISYRRGDSADLARLIQTKLQLRGWRVFLDVDDLRPGHFDEALLKYIADAPNFLVILMPGSLDRCADQDDWLRREIVQAIREGRNMIPLMAKGFCMPSPVELPEEMRALSRQHGLEYSHQYFEATMEKLVSFLRR